MSALAVQAVDRGDADALRELAAMREKAGDSAGAEALVVRAAEADGRLRSRQIWASGRRPAAGVGLTMRAGRARVMDHVEPQAAAIMRRPGVPRDGILVVNNAPCGELDQPLMCDPLLPDILPEGSTLTVYLSDGADTTFYRTYTGTGRRIV